MTAFLSPHEDRIYAAFRIVAGFMFTCHGAQKIFGAFGGAPDMPAPMLWLSGGIELVGGALVMVGFFAGWAAFLCSGLMAFAYFLAHQTNGLLPIQNLLHLSEDACQVRDHKTQQEKQDTGTNQRHENRVHQCCLPALDFSEFRDRYNNFHAQGVNLGQLDDGLVFLRTVLVASRRNV